MPAHLATIIYYVKPGIGPEEAFEHLQELDLSNYEATLLGFRDRNIHIQCPYNQEDQLRDQFDLELEKLLVFV